MRAVHVVPRLHVGQSGLGNAVRDICRAQRAVGLDIELHVLSPQGQEVGGGVSVRTHASLPVLRSVGVSPSMQRALREAARSADVLHNHGLWMMPNVYPADAVRGTRCRLVASPHGVFSPWALSISRWKKRLFWHALQSRAFTEAACLHATVPHEHEDIRRQGLRAPVAIVPNGVHLPERLAFEEPPTERRRLLFLSRLHPTKGVEFLIESWREVQDRFPEWEVRVVGPPEGDYLERMQALVDHLGAERVTFAGAAYGEEKEREFRSADLFVLPTRSENFGLAVAEALAYGLPVVVTQGAPWSGLLDHRCGWWPELGTGPLVEVLRDALPLPRETLREMGLRGREWMAADYSWERTGGMLRATYEWLVGGGPAPDWVLFD